MVCNVTKLVSFALHFSNWLFYKLCLYSLLKAPPGINPLEHEEVPMTVQQNVKPTRAAAPQNPTPRQEGGFGHVTALPVRFSIKPNETVSYFRARMDNRNVVLRVLKGELLQATI